MLRDQVVDLDVACFGDKQRLQVCSQLDFLDQTLANIFKTDSKEAFSKCNATLKGSTLVLELVANARDLVPALDIKLIGFQVKKKIGYKESDLVLVLKEVKDGKTS